MAVGQLTCSVDDCGRRRKGLGYCIAHYQRVKAHGDPQSHIPIQSRGNLSGPCVVDGCSRDITNRTLGLCRAHYSRSWRDGDVGASVPLAPPSLSPVLVVDYADGTRGCQGCGERKPLGEYHRDSKSPLGRRKKCKLCRVARESERYWSDPETFKARVRQRRADDPAAVRAYDSAQYWKHREKKIESAISNTHVRRARIERNGFERGITVTALRKLHGDSCYYCGVVMVFSRSHKPGKRPQNLATLEHLTPIARGGGHVWDNCRLSCWACNISKGADDYPLRLLMR